MADPNFVNPQITDAVTQTTVKVLAESPTTALGMVYQLLSQSVGLAMQNSTSHQHSMQQVNTATTTAAVQQILYAGSRFQAAAPAPPPAPAPAPPAPPVPIPTPVIIAPTGSQTSPAGAGTSTSGTSTSGTSASGTSASGTSSAGTSPSTPSSTPASSSTSPTQGTSPSTR